MAGKRMLNVNEEWIDLSKVVNCWFHKRPNMTAFYYILENYPEVCKVYINHEEAKQFQDCLEKVFKYFCSTCKFEYKKPVPQKTKPTLPSSATKTTEAPKAKGYYESSGIPK